MKKKRIAFIVNKTAGRNHTARIWRRLEPRLREQRQDFSVFFTSGKGSGSDLAGQVQEQGFSRIVVVGGDGTLHETINGIDPGLSEIGIIPTGTGNDFCRSINLPGDPFEAPGYIFSDNLRRVDLGRVNGHLFVNVAGIGFDAEVARRINTSPVLQHFSGTIAYLLGVFAALLNYKNTPVKISADDKTISGDVFLAAVGNACYYGGGMKIVPQAKIDDGLLHLCIGLDINLWDALTTLPKIFSGRHTEHPKVICLAGKNILITAAKPLAVHADGEIISSTPARFEILPASLAVVCP